MLEHSFLLNCARIQIGPVHDVFVQEAGHFEQSIDQPVANHSNYENKADEIKRETHFR